MKDLIEALTIFSKYGDPYSPTHCEHDELHVMIDPDEVSEEDHKRLEKLGFFDSRDGTFKSFRFGSA